MSKIIAVCAVQGAFIEHEKMFQTLGAECIELRQKSDLEKHFDALVLPGGESTVQGKLIKELGMFNIMKEQIESGLPVLATCAGLILLAQQISNDERRYFQTLPVTVCRNAYGRQLGSFNTTGDVTGINNFPEIFIRAPGINCTLDNGDRDKRKVEIISKTGTTITGVRYKNQTAFVFHPELTNDTRIHEEFLRMI